MSVIQFLKDIVPNFERSRILDDVASQIDYLDKTAIPSFRNAGKVMAGRRLVAKQSLEFVGGVFYVLPKYKPRGLFIGMAEYLEQVRATLGQLEGVVTEMFGEDVTKETLTYRKTTVLSYLSSARFVAHYATSMLSLVLAAETSEALQQDTPGFLEQQLTKAERMVLENNAQRFLDTLPLLDRKPEAVIQAIETIPEMTVSDDKDKLMNQTAGQQQLDPLKLNFGPIPSLTLLYRARQFVAEWQHDSYKAGVEEARVLELRIMDLKYALAGKQDAATQKVLDVTKGRLDKLRARLRDYEERYA